MLTPKGVREDFCQDLSAADQDLVLAVQGATPERDPRNAIKKAAWHSKPSWFVIASNDRTIAPEQEISTAREWARKL